MSNISNESSKSRQSVVSLANNSENFRERYQALAGTLLQKLQTSLELEEILQIFAEQVRHIVAFQRFTYHNNGCHLELGTEKNVGRHELDYQLSLQGQSLGSLKIQRSYRFQEVEMEAFEALVGSLIYPLRNATLYREAQMAALTDSLTGAANQRALSYQMTRDISLAKRYEQPLSMLVLDVDFFKQINDTYGHAGGDKVLQAVVQVINHCSRDSDSVFRCGGEEFAVILPNATPTDAIIIAERIRVAIEEYEFSHNGGVIKATISIGCATYRNGESGNQLMERADQALYCAKRSGRNRVCLEAQCKEEAASA